MSSVPTPRPRYRYPRRWPHARPFNASGEMSGTHWIGETEASNTPVPITKTHSWAPNCVVLRLGDQPPGSWPGSVRQATLFLADRLGALASMKVIVLPVVVAAVISCARVSSRIRIDSVPTRNRVYTSEHQLVGCRVEAHILARPRNDACGVLGASRSIPAQA